MPIVHTSPPQPALNADALLQASRRLDWRFLLPDPGLGRVAYVGAAQPALIDALQHFAAQVDLWEAPAAGEACGEHVRAGYDGYDLVVAHAPGEAALAQAAALIRAGGWLYLEARGPLASKRGAAALLRRGSRMALPGYLAALRRLGLEHLQAFWIWPDFATCTKIIPIDHLATVAQFQLARLRPALLNRFLRSQIVPRVVDSHMAHAAIPCFGVVAQRPVAQSLMQPVAQAEVAG